MKKSLSLVLAVVLAFGASATAFAAHVADVNITIEPVMFAQTTPGTVSANKGTVNVTGDFQPGGSTTDIYESIIDTRVNKLNDPINKKNDKVANSKAFYLELDTDDDMKAKDILKTKVKADWTIGKDLVEKVSVVYKKYTSDGSTFQYGYFVEIKAKPGIMMSAADLNGTVKVSKSSLTSVPAQQQFDFGFGTYGEADVQFTATDNTATKTTNHIVWDTSDNADSAGETYAKIVSFEKNVLTETTITFNGIGEYEIDVKDQDKLYLAFDRKINADIIAKHPAANVEFINFPGKPAFYKTGLMSLYADDAETFVYEIKDDGTVAAVKTVWDEEYEAHKFAVRQFAGTYIISDVELQLEAAVVTPGAPETETKPNPNTGR